MTNQIQGNIFLKAEKENYDLAIILGHCGLNVITSTFRSWLLSDKKIAESFENADKSQMAIMYNPFNLSGPHEYSAKRYIWFFKDENGAMSDATLRAAMENSASWASNNGLKNIIINGIKNIDGTNDDIQRIEFMTALASDLERKYNIIFTLISTDESFIASK